MKKPVARAKSRSINVVLVESATAAPAWSQTMLPEGNGQTVTIVDRKEVLDERLNLITHVSEHGLSGLDAVPDPVFVGATWKARMRDMAIGGAVMAFGLVALGASGIVPGFSYDFSDEVPAVRALSGNGDNLAQASLDVDGKKPKPVLEAPSSIEKPGAGELKPAEILDSASDMSDAPSDTMPSLPRVGGDIVPPGIANEISPSTGISGPAMTDLEAPAIPSEELDLDGMQVDATVLDQFNRAIAQLRETGSISEETLNALPIQIRERMAGMIASRSTEEIREGAAIAGRIVHLPEEVVAQYRSEDGIASIPEANTWLSTGGMIVLSKPGGGNIRKTEDLMKFGLNPF